MDNRRIIQKPWGRLWNFVPLKGEGEAGSGGDCSDVVEIWSREAGGCVLYATDTRIGCRLSLPEKPPTGRFFWVVRIGSLLGGFSLTKAMHKLGKLHKVQLRVAQNKSKILQKV